MAIIAGRIFAEDAVRFAALQPQGRAADKNADANRRADVGAAISWGQIRANAMVTGLRMK
jgi:hypothetical protein